MGILDPIPGYGEVGPGYKNPLGEDASPIGSNYDWGSFSKGIDWSQTPEIANRSKWQEAFSKGDAWKKQEQEKQKQQQFGSSGFSGGAVDLPSIGGALVQPNQFAPFVVGGMPGEEGWGSKLTKSIIGGATGFATGGPLGALQGGAAPWVG